MSAHNLFRTPNYLGFIILFSATTHIVALIGLIQISIPSHTHWNHGKEYVHPPIQVTLLTKPLVTPKVTTLKATPVPAAHQIVNKSRPFALQPSPQIKLFVSKVENKTVMQPTDNVAHGVTTGGDSMNSSITGANSITDIGEQRQADIHTPPINTTPSAEKVDLRPTQEARPDYSYNPQPDYPLLLREQGVGGVVWLRVWVASDGHPMEIKIAKGSGYRLLDEAALRAVKQWRFIPAKNGDKNLASWVEFPIRFTLNG